MLSVKGIVVGHIQHREDTDSTLWSDAVDFKEDILARMPASKQAFFATLLRLIDCVSIVRRMKGNAGSQAGLRSIVEDTVDLIVRDLLPPELWQSFSTEVKSPLCHRLYSMFSVVKETRQREQTWYKSCDPHDSETIANLWQLIWEDDLAEKGHLRVKQITMLIASLAKHERVLVVLDTGYISPVHNSYSHGDAVALVAGVDYPMVLRPTVSNKYRVICTSWICSAMHGELWPEDDSELTQLDLV